MDELISQFPSAPKGSRAGVRTGKNGIVIRFPPKGLTSGYGWHLAFSFAYAGIGIVIWMFPGFLADSPLWWILTPGFVLGGAILFVSTIRWSRRWIVFKVSTAGLSVGSTHARKLWHWRLGHAEITSIQSQGKTVVIKTVSLPMGYRFYLHDAPNTAAWTVELLQNALEKWAPAIPKPPELPMHSKITRTCKNDVLSITIPPNRRLWGGLAIAAACYLVLMTFLLIRRLLDPQTGDTILETAGLGLLTWIACLPWIACCWYATRYPTIIEASPDGLSITRPHFCRNRQQKWKNEDIESMSLVNHTIILRQKGRGRFRAEIFISNLQRRELFWVFDTIQRETGRS